MRNWTSSDRFQVSRDALARKLPAEGRIAVVHMKTKRTHVLNATAAVIWRLIEAGNSREEIQQNLERSYQLKKSEISDEIDQLLLLLSEEDLIHRTQ